MNLLPVSMIIATKSRAGPLSRALESLEKQSATVLELIVIDGSTDSASRQAVEQYSARCSKSCGVVWRVADTVGAGAQRNQGVSIATQPFVCFSDDDVLFEPSCIELLARAIRSDAHLGGVNAMIVNQRYHPPGFISRLVFTIMQGHSEMSFAGKVIGPAVNLLPEDRNDLPEVVPVEWLNLGCTMYRREALPDQPFDSFFTGYSLMEDLALSLKVAQQGWNLANVRTARIFHDIQGGEHKENVADLSRMELLNRYHVMTEVLKCDRFTDFVKLGIFELFQLASSAHSRPTNLPAVLKGKIAAVVDILH